MIDAVATPENPNVAAPPPPEQTLAIYSTTSIENSGDCDSPPLAGGGDMANYPCDPVPHLPPGADYMPYNALRPQRGYVVLGGSFSNICDDWAIIRLEPEPTWDQLEGTAALVTAQIEQRGYEVRQVSRSALGAAMVRFEGVIDRDNAIRNSPYFIGETVMRILTTRV